MSRYANSSIYKICCKDINITDIYVGSTMNFNRRKTSHRTKCNNEKDPAYNYYLYDFIRLNGGWKNWDMIVIEHISVKSKIELCSRERYWLEKLGATLNKWSPIRTEDERKNYYEKNKDKMKEQMKEYRANNKDKIKDKMKEYRGKNKGKIKDKRKDKIECECGSIVRKNNLPRHKKSKKHLNFYFVNS